MTVSIALVLDSNCGTRVAEFARKMPVWILSSEINDAAVKEARLGLRSAQITVLHTRPGETAADSLIRALYAVDEHHGQASQSTPYKLLWVHGTTERPPQDVVSDLNFKSITEIVGGFKAEK